MTIIESTIAFLFRPSVKLAPKEDRHRQKTCRILRDITDPAESVAECLVEQSKTTDHDTATKATAATSRAIK